MHFYDLLYIWMIYRQSTTFGPTLQWWRRNENENIVRSSDNDDGNILENSVLARVVRWRGLAWTLDWQQGGGPQGVSGISVKIAPVNSAWFHWLKHNYKIYFAFLGLIYDIDILVGGERRGSRGEPYLICSFSSLSITSKMLRCQVIFSILITSSKGLCRRVNILFLMIF